MLLFLIMCITSYFHLNFFLKNIHVKKRVCSVIFLFSSIKVQLTEYVKIKDTVYQVFPESKTDEELCRPVRTVAFPTVSRVRIPLIFNLSVLAI